MSIVSIVVTIAVVGLILWVANTYIPMESRVKSIVNGVVIVALVFWILQSFGFLSSCGHIRFGA